MARPIAFADILDAAETLDDESQAALVQVLSRRLAERGRARVVTTVEQAEREFDAGQCRAMTAAEIIREAMD